jgi:cell division protein FtsL
MKNPWLVYAAVRVGIFAGILAIMLLLQFDAFFAALIAAVLSLAISILFLGKQRSAVSEAIYKARQIKGDKDTEAEDAKP